MNKKELKNMVINAMKKSTNDFGGIPDSDNFHFTEYRVRKGFDMIIKELK